MQTDVHVYIHVVNSCASVKVDDDILRPGRRSRQTCYYFRNGVVLQTANSGSKNGEKLMRRHKVALQACNRTF